MNLVSWYIEELKKLKIGDDEIESTLQRELESQKGFNLFKQYLGPCTFADVKINQGETGTVTSSDLAILSLIEGIPKGANLGSPWFFLPKGIQFGIREERKQACFSPEITKLVHGLFSLGETDEKSVKETSRQFYHVFAKDSEPLAQGAIREIVTDRNVTRDVLSAYHGKLPKINGTAQVLFTPLGMAWEHAGEQTLFDYPTAWQRTADKLLEKYWGSREYAKYANYQKTTIYSRFVRILNSCLRKHFLKQELSGVAPAEKLLRSMQNYGIEIVPREISEDDKFAKRSISWIPEVADLTALEEVLGSLFSTGALRFVKGIMFSKSDHIPKDKLAAVMWARAKVAERLSHKIQFRFLNRQYLSSAEDNKLMLPLDMLIAFKKGGISRTLFINEGELRVLQYDRGTFVASILSEISGLCFAACAPEQRREYACIVQPKVGRQMEYLQAHGAENLAEAEFVGLAFATSFIKSVRSAMDGVWPDNPDGCLIRRILLGS